MAAAKTVIAREQFAAEIDGQTVIVLAGARFKATDPVVKANAEKFEREPPIEQATAAPGETRP
jgi:hypothetical protein